MRGYNEVNYCVYIKEGNDRFYKFAKHSIVDNVSNDPCHEPINNKFVYDTFFMLYPILNEIDRELIVIKKAWSSWHPLNSDEKMPTNEYDKRDDDCMTRIFDIYCTKGKNYIEK